MSQNYEMHLAVREEQFSGMRKARQRLKETAVSPDGRSPAKAKGKLLREAQNSIFSDAWITVALILLAVGMIADRNPGILALSFILLIVAGVGYLWKSVALTGVAYERTFDRTRAFPNEPIEMSGSIVNDKPLPLTWLQFQDELPIAPEKEGAIARAVVETTGRWLWKQSFSLTGYERAQRSVTLQFPARGYYTIGPITYKSSDVFMLFTVTQQRQHTDTLVIYPQIWPLEALGLPAKEPFGDVKVRRSLFTDPIKTRGIRDYQPQDRFRDVHWKATARRGALQTKVYDPSTGMTMAVFLNVATLPKHWMGFEPELLERAVSVAGSMANYGTEQGWGVGLYANGALPNSDQPIRVQPGRSPEQLIHVLEALAAVTEFATGSIERMLFRESPSLPWAATIVLVTAVVTDEIMVAMIRLKEAGRRVVLISLADEPPPQSNVLTYHIPATTPVFEENVQMTAVENALAAIPAPLSAKHRRHASKTRRAQPR